MAEVCVLSLRGWLESDVAPYLGFASAERRTTVSRFRAASDRNRSLWAELFARWRIAETTKVPLPEIEIAHDEKGKPFCPELPVSVSLSHSGAYLAVAVGKNALGVDVERRRKLNLSVSKRWFRPEEHAFLLSQPEEGRAQSFLRLWTLKEAALKCTGEGLSGGLETVDCFALLEAAKTGTADTLAGRSFPLDGAMAGIVARREELPKIARLFTLEHGGQGIYGNAFFAERDAILPV
ncbi:MAG: 4'-phosphopantetheinyl transferase superfamily protein [Schwartzia sp.]|nr:4'-phosphopantetheinyl transferase superfamily protein [Schwartzia sp. (in: firmicutes)]